MLLSLEAFKQQKFDQVTAKIMADPESYLAFDSVSDFYKAEWLDEFPQMSFHKGRHALLQD